MICFAIASSISSDSMRSLDHAPRCPFEGSRLKHAKSQRNKKSLICSEGEPTLLFIQTCKEVEVAASVSLPLREVEHRLTARRRAEQV